MRTAYPTLFVVFLSLFTISSLAQEKSGLEKLNLRGPVKKVETYNLIPPADGKGLPQSQISTMTSFNRGGQAIESRSYSSPGEFATRQVNIYDAKGRRILVESYSGFGRNELNKAWEESSDFVYKYDTAGRIIEQSEIFKPLKEAGRRVQLRYDMGGNVIEELHFAFRDKTPIERKTYTVDSKGRITSEAKFDLGGTLVAKTAFFFNPNGQLRETIAERKDMPGQHITTYQYDDQNRLVVAKTELSHLSEKSVGRVETSYDDAKLTKVERGYGDDVMLTKSVYQLDKYGNTIAKTESLTDEAMKGLTKGANVPSTGLTPSEISSMLPLNGVLARERFTYEYDSRGNWTKRIEYLATQSVSGSDNFDAELKPIGTQVRTITYYD